MPQDLPLVLRLPRVDPDADPSFVLLEVLRGQPPLDFKLIGTDGSAVYSVSVNHGQTAKFKAMNNKSSQEEWEHVLSTVLLGVGPQEKHVPATKGVEAVAKVDEDAITVTLQKRIEGITQKLGEFSIPASEDEISLVDWCGLSIQSKDKCKQEMEALKASVREKDEQIQRLNESHAELISLKNASEDQLLENFSRLLNEKKLKIRDQQRLLAASSVGPVKSEEVDRTRSVTRDRSAGPSRKGKRKAGVNQEIMSDKSDGGFEKMDVDDAPPVIDSEQDEERTASETDSDDESPPAPNTRKTRETSAQPSRRSKESCAQPSTSQHLPNSEKIPPKRELPFARKPPAPMQRPPIPEGSETESDDEL